MAWGQPGGMVTGQIDTCITVYIYRCNCSATCSLRQGKSNQCNTYRCDGPVNRLTINVLRKECFKVPMK